jgi:hypothetical protein
LRPAHIFSRGAGTAREITINESLSLIAGWLHRAQDWRAVSMRTSMKRLVLAFFIAAALAAPAEAASRSIEKGVRVWRGGKAEVAPPAVKAEPRREACAVGALVVLHKSYWPVRRLRVHGFSAGDGFAGPGKRVGGLMATSGFYADRMAAGL